MIERSEVTEEGWGDHEINANGRVGSGASLMVYMLKPVFRSLDTAFTER